MKINDEKLYKLLEKKDALVLAGRKQSELVEKEQQELNKCGLKIQKIKDKVVPLMNGYKKQWREEGVLGEFEEVTGVELVDGEIVITKVDMLEEYKKALREQMYGAEEPNDETDEGEAKDA